MSAALHKGESGMRTVSIFSIRAALFAAALIALTVSGMNAQTPPAGLAYGRNDKGGVTITKYTGSAATLVIPAAIEGLPVTTIGQSAFEDCTGLRSVTIPNSVTQIGNEAFWKCEGLTSVTIPASVTQIGEAPFAWCTSLTGIVVEQGNPAYVSVDGVLFTKDQKILMAYPAGKKGAYTIPSSVTSIGNSAFSGCEGLTNVTIPSSVTSIENGAFRECTGLRSVTLSRRTRVGNGAFPNRTRLTYSD